MTNSVLAELGRTSLMYLGVELTQSATVDEPQHLMEWYRGSCWAQHHYATVGSKSNALTMLFAMTNQDMRVQAFKNWTTSSL